MKTPWKLDRKILSWNGINFDERSEFPLRLSRWSGLIELPIHDRWLHSHARSGRGRIGFDRLRPDTRARVADWPLALISLDGAEIFFSVKANYWDSSENLCSKQLVELSRMRGAQAKCLSARKQDETNEEKSKAIYREITSQRCRETQLVHHHRRQPWTQLSATQTPPPADKSTSHPPFSR